MIKSRNCKFSPSVIWLSGSTISSALGSRYFANRKFLCFYLIVLLQNALRYCDADELPNLLEPLEEQVNPTEVPSNFAFTPTTANPTPILSSEPSFFPTVEPTSIPSILLSEVPSDEPSSVSSLKPSNFLSEAPTSVPSDRPSMLSSVSPSLFSSVAPSTEPSSLPSSTPTSLPSSFPSKNPSSTPTLLSSTAPSSIPSILPSISSIPSSNPTLTPSASPSSLPTLHPSSHPSNFPSLTPSTPPSLSPTLQLQTEGVNSLVMSFDDCPILDDENIRIWQNVTSNHIEMEIKSLTLDILQLDITTSLESQCVSPRERCNRRLHAKKNENIEKNPRRSLQSKQPLTLFFSIEVSFRSTNYNHSLSDYVIGAFDSKDDRLKYIINLQSNGDIFGPINTVTTMIGGTISEDVTQNISRKEIVIYASSGAGALFVLGLIIFLCVERKKKKKTKTIIINPSPVMNDFNDDENVAAAFVNINPNVYDDISTIGDPIYPPGIKFAAPKQPGDNDSASNSTYDYANMYGGTGEMYSASSVGAETNASRNTFLTSDNSQSSPRISRGHASISNLETSERNHKEERIEVRAPPGKLGMVIDTPNGGSPIVHAIRDNSIMFHKVRIGDKLISFDGEDTTRMGAKEVSKLISARVNNPVRLLVFTRTQKVIR